jgi:hypothetical protein
MNLTAGVLLGATRGRLVAGPGAGQGKPRPCGDLLLVKASHGIALHEVVQELIPTGIQKRDVGLSGGASS